MNAPVAPVDRFDAINAKLIEHEEVIRMLGAIAQLADQLSHHDSRENVGAICEDLWPGLRAVTERLCEESATVRDRIEALNKAESQP